MTYRLSKSSLVTAIEHLCLYGDTDVFPHLPELVFIREREADVISELVKLDLDSYNPGNSVEVLGPKSRYGFRIVHQLPLIDTILLLASVIEIASLIEGHRTASTNIKAFSYRFSVQPKGSIFKPDHTPRKSPTCWRFY